MKEVFSKGYAQGLSSHSSMQHSSAIFNNSEVFELSSISPNQNKSFSKSDPLPDLLNLNCRFCGRNNKSSDMVQVCKCNSKYMAHNKCVQGQAEGKCKKCGAKWLQDLSVFKCSPDIIIENSSNLSHLNESEGEFKMRNTIKAAIEKPKCRICAEESETEENKIIYPCQCHTLDYRLARAHRKCVLDLALMSHKDECENCKVLYNFDPIYQNVWVCDDNELFCQYFTDFFKFFILASVLLGLAGFLFEFEDWYSEDSQMWIWSVGIRTLLLLLGTIYSGLFIFYLAKIRNKVLTSLEVLCQKQEIARMSSKSHENFDFFLRTMIKYGKISEVPVVVKRPSVKTHKIESIPRRILELDTNGENIDSVMLKEFSSDKASISFHKSEDFKEEDINEHSFNQ